MTDHSHQDDDDKPASLFPDLPEHRKPIYGAERDVRFSAVYAQILALFVSTGTDRPYLNGIGVFPHPDFGVILVATDGHRMAVIHDKDGHTDNVWICPVPKTMLAGIKAPKTDSEESSETVDRLVHFVGRVGYVTTHAVEGDVRIMGSEHLVAVDAPAIEGEFPAFEKVMPYRVTGNYCVAVSPSLLADFVKAAEIWGKHEGDIRALQLIAQNEAGPHAVSIELFPQFSGLIMPRKVRDLAPEFERPRWYDRLPSRSAPPVQPEEPAEPDQPVFDGTDAGRDHA